MITPKFRIYKRNMTEHWSEDVVRRAGTLYDVYIFNEHRHVHCCEITPSYEMNYLGPTWDGNGPDAPGEDEEKRNQLYQDIARAVNDTDDVMYVHVRSVNLDDCEIITITDEQWARYLRTHDNDAEAAYKAALDMEMEYCLGNGFTY